MIISKSYKAVVTAVMILGVLAPVAAMAQTYQMATMPILYNSAGQAVNVNNITPLPAGYYALAPGGQQVYYFGNGTFYNSATGIYGGSAVNNPNGVAGVNLGYSVAVQIPGSTYVATTPGVPNTGAGGEAMATWVTLLVAGAIVAVGSVYLVATRKDSTVRSAM